jgi:chromosome segregation ATPase
MNPYEIEDTDNWLGCPTPLETCRHQLRMYENEFEELTLQLRQAREKIFKLVEMHSEAISQRDEAMANLRERSGESANLRKQLYDLNISARAHQREVERLRGILDGLVDPTKTSEQTT